MLLHDEQYLYRDKDDNWYLVFSPDKRTRQILGISSKPQTFIDLSTGNLLVSFIDKKVRSLNDVQSKEEIDKILDDLDFSRRDWKETNIESSGYIKNKPTLSQLGDLYYTIDKLGDDKQITYELHWYPYNDRHEYQRVGSIIIDKNRVLTSGTIFVANESNPDLIPGSTYMDLVIEGYNTTHVYILMDPVVDRYIGHSGIIIENNEISIKVDKDCGLDDGIKLNIATKDTNGAISAEDYRRLNNIDLTPYATIEDIENGSIIPKTSKFTENFIAPEGDGIEELSQSFSFRSTGGNISIGTGQAKLTEVRGSINPYNPQEFISIGNNSFNIKNKRENTNIVNSTLVEDSNYDIYWFKCIRADRNVSVNEPIKNNGYSIFGDTLGEIGFTTDDPQTVQDVITLTPSSTVYESETYKPENTGYILISLPKTSDPTKICAKLSWSGIRDDIYDEFIETRIPLKKPENNTWGLLDNGIIYDKWYNVDDILWFEQVWGRVDLGTLTWENNKSSGISDLVKPETTNLLGSSNGIVVDENGILISSINNPQGILYYELNEKITYNTEINSLYYAGDYGTEEFTGSEITGKSNHLYLPNLYDQLRNFRGDLTTKLGWSDIDKVINGVSTNPVQGKVIREYLDTVISSLDSVRDLSRFDIYGVPNTGMTTANCYVISEPGYYKIPLVYGNGINNGNINSVAYTLTNTNLGNITNFVNYKGNVISSPYIETDTGTRAERGLVCWSEESGMITDTRIIPGKTCRYLLFKVNNIPTYGSNALIAAADGSDTIMWSWHIWIVPNVDTLHPKRIVNSVGTTYYVMPVNLGYVWPTSGQYNTNVNVYYQWGRKDPMPRSNTTYGERPYGVYGTAYDEDNTKTIPNSIQIPNKFFTQYAPDSTGNYNWHAPVTSGSGTSIFSAYNLWDVKRSTTGTGNSNSIKSIYDPSPVGFKVNPGDGYTRFSLSNVIGSFDKGWTFPLYSGDTEGLFFPASGYRYRGSGGLDYVSSSGYCWSSASNSQAYACSLNFDAGYVYPVNNDSRAYGFSVRPFVE
jgi:hypothetical protein